MRLISYRANAEPNAVTGVGVMTGDTRFIALAEAAPDLPSTLKEILELEDGLARAAAATAGKEGTRGLDDVILDPVIPAPTAIWALALNFHSHVAETGLTTSPDYPHIFQRNAGGQVGCGQPLLCPDPAVARAFDYEGELAVIIGRGGRNIPTDKAADHVAGYSIYNEGSVREFQGHNRQFGIGKNFEQSGAFGPWLMTPDEFGDPYEKSISSRLNGITRQHESISGVIFKIDRLIEYISTGYQLRPGDVIVSGTPGALKPADDDKEAQIDAHYDGAVKYAGRVHMKPGDVCEVEIDGLGILRNPVVADKKGYQVF